MCLNILQFKLFVLISYCKCPHQRPKKADTERKANKDLCSKQHVTRFLGELCGALFSNFQVLLVMEVLLAHLSPQAAAMQKAIACVAEQGSGNSKGGCSEGGGLSQ